VQILARLIGIVLWAALCAGVQAQDSAKEPPKAAPTTAGECQPKRSMLPDGTVIIQNRDCSMTRVSKEEMLKPPSGQSDAQQPPQDQSPQVGKLREMKPQAPPSGVDDPKLGAKYLEAMNGYFDYYTAGYRHRQRVFEWQLVSSKIIFVLVTFLVFSGIYFAALQFHEGMRHRAAEAMVAKAKGGAVHGEKPPTREDSAVTTFSASAKGIEVSSPVLGVVILVISLAFFYLYLVYVYPITELF
jgi:hypothetical protein